MELLDISRDLREGKSGFGFWWGHFYSKRLCDEMFGLEEEGLVRTSMVSALSRLCCLWESQYR
jgi:hypothetical protein